ncbi:MAG: right-handed parallel beta-helix repeat-containing protein [Desulfobulbaceae bacterium]
MHKHCEISPVSYVSRRTCRQSLLPPFLGGFIALLLFLIFSGSCAAIVYVDLDRPGGNGTSWAQAYKTLDEAISNNRTPQEFWIAEGTYTPAAPLVLGQGQDHSFYGGFTGTETARSQRNTTAHPTIVDGQGVLKHIFNVTSWVTSVRFDGLTIKRGAATAVSGADASGGGVVVNQGAVVIANCTFTDNRATHLGGAVYLVNNPSITITGSTFRNNTLSGAGGGAGVAVTRNQAGAQPPAIVEKCTFQGNTGGSVGGGLYSILFPVTVRESTFIANSSANGGAIMLDFKLSAADRIERCLFLGNTGTERGGAICSYARSVEIENSVFAHNVTTAIPATGGGGAVSLHSGQGDAAHYNSAYVGTFRNCTFYGNQADSSYGGGIQNIGSHPMYIYNSIFWRNTALSYWMDAADRPTDDIATYETSTTIRYTDMETLGAPNPPAYVNQVGSFSADPLCSDPDGSDNIPGTADDDLSIPDSSPCTDTADGDQAPETDIALRPRVDSPAKVNLGVGNPNYADIGAYEGPYSPPVVIPPPVVPDGVNMVPVLNLLLSRRAR